MKMEIKRIAIIGLGLIGGSLAKAFRRKSSAVDITAVSKSSQPIEQAVSEGIINRGFTRLNDYVFNADIIYICTPVRTALKYIDLLTGKVASHCIVTDVCSTKTEIIRYVEKAGSPFRFVGGHPMAGSEKSGYSASVEHLFENAYYIICPTLSSDEAAVSEVTSLARAAGALPVIMDSVKHDAATGAISHLPHILASALVNLVSRNDTDGSLRTLASGGFRDITRIASSDPQMWENIVLSNCLPISGLIDEFIDTLKCFKTYMEDNNGADVFRFFHSARDYRNSLPAGGRGLIAPLYDIIADIVDKPGSIGEVASLLGNNGVNIKNINVSNSREFEEGCLIISLPDLKSVDIARRLLLENGYRAYKK